MDVQLTSKNELMIEGAKIRFKNFGGAPSKFNKDGKRTFCVLLDEDVADDLKRSGWNIKYLDPLEPGDSPTPYMQVTVKYTEGRGPSVFTITSRGQTRLDEASIHILDWAEMTNVDLIIRPYNWEVQGNKGVVGYLKTLYATLYENPLELKYAGTCVGPDCARDIIHESSGFDKED